MTIIRVSDLRSAGICPEARVWCKKHGIDWRDFVANGISVDVLRATGDNLCRIEELERVALRRINGAG